MTECTSSTQVQNKIISPLGRKIFTTDTFWDGKITLFFSDTWYINNTPEQAPDLGIIGQQKSVSMAFSVYVFVVVVGGVLV